ncbi:LEPR-XLL domain-containing protein [Marinobacterium mangrovicola]|uniref:Ca2+-binding RTX toxin-like protein n=1 Tax=Marinobacterium mangrovicola TaxID=1476959 RepID=A0A4R1GGH7_9GAMM|nr:LEPR-XLL domain-containing protein [Marinobacterium mangrovicola]TCK07577.1 Ca2+-binding RTX toxin-like protein [Marinobacterium mangrovicola]
MFEPNELSWFARKSIPRKVPRLFKRKSHQGSPALPQVEALEPRFLLSADLVPFDFAIASDLAADVTLRLDDADEYLQIVDQDGELLEERLLQETSEVRITGSDQSDSLTIGLDSPLSIDVLFFGEQGDDRLIGPSNDAHWIIDGENSGEVFGVRFSDVETLEGAAGNEDLFTFESGGFVDLLEGGDGGFDTVEVSGGASQTYTPTGPDSGFISVDGELIEYRGFEPVEITNPTLGTGTITFDLSSLTDDSFKLSFDSNPDDFKLESLSGSIEEHIFTDPGVGGTITIQLGSGNESITLSNLEDLNADVVILGGAGNDTYYIEDGWAPNLTLTEGDSGGDDTLNFSGFAAGPISVTPTGANEVTIVDSAGAESAFVLSGGTEDNIENIVGADLEMADSQFTELLDGVDSLIAFSTQLMSYEQFDTELPILRDDSGNGVKLGQLNGLVELLDELRHEIADYQIDNAGALDTDSLVTHLDNAFSGGGRTLEYLGASILAPLGIEDGDWTTSDEFSFVISTASGLLSLFDNETVTVTTSDDTVQSFVDDLNAALITAGFTGQLVAGERDGRIYFQVTSDEVSDLQVSAADTATADLFGIPEEGIIPGEPNIAIDDVQSYLSNTGDLTLKVLGGAGLVVSIENGAPKIRLDLDLEGTRSSDFGIQLGDEGDGNGIVFSDLSRMQADTSVNFDLSLSLLSAFGGDDFSLDVSSLESGINANSTTTKDAVSGVDASHLQAEVGFLAVYAEGELDLDAGLQVNLAQTSDIDQTDLSDDFDTSGTLIDTDATPLTETDAAFTGSASMTIDLQLRIDDHINAMDNFDYLAAITTSDSNPFLSANPDLLFDGNTEGSAVTGGFQHFLNFTAIDPTGIVSVLGQYASTLDKLRNNDLLHSVEIPFVSAGLDQLLDWGEIFSDALLFDEGADDSKDGGNRLVTDLNNALETAGLGGLVKVQGSGSAIEFITVDPDLTNLKVVEVDSGIYDAFGFTGTEELAVDDGDVWRLVASPAVLGSLAAGVFKVSYKRNGVGSFIETDVEITADMLSDNTGLGDDTAKLLDANNSATYRTAQEFAQLLRIFGIDQTANYSSGANYDESTERLSYEINLASADLFAFELPTDFELDLAPLLDIESDTRLVVTADGGLDMILGFDLSDAGLAGGSINGENLSDFGVEVKTDPAITAEASPSTLVGRLTSDAHFTLTVTETDNNVETYDFTIAAADTEDNVTIEDLVSDLNDQLANDAALDALIEFGWIDNRVAVAEEVAGSLKSIQASAESSDSAVSQIGIPSVKLINNTDPGALDSGDRLFMAGTGDARTIIGQLDADASFDITLNYSGTDFDAAADTGNRVTTTVTILQADTESNTNIIDLQADIRNAFANTYLGGSETFLGSDPADPETPTLSQLLDVNVQGTRLVITLQDGASFNADDVEVAVSEFKLTSGSNADQLGFGAAATEFDSNNADLLITQADGTSYTVSFDSGDLTFDDIIGAINAAGSVVASYGLDDPSTPNDESNTYIVLTDPSFTAFDEGEVDPNPASFRVEGLNASKASIQLGLNAGLFDPGIHPTGQIEGKAIGGVTVADRFYVSSSNLDQFLTASARVQAGHLIEGLEVVTTGASTELTSGDYAFASDVVGLDIEVFDASGFVAGTYEITAVDTNTNTITIDWDTSALSIAGLSGGIGVLQTGVNATARVGFVGVNITGELDVGIEVALGISDDAGSLFDTDGVLTLDQLQNVDFSDLGLRDVFDLPTLSPLAEIQAIDAANEYGYLDLEVGIEAGSVDFSAIAALFDADNPTISMRIVASGDPLLGLRLVEADYTQLSATTFEVDGDFSALLTDAELDSDSNGDPDGDEQYLVITLPPVDPDDETSKPTRAKVVSAVYDSIDETTLVTIEALSADDNYDDFTLPDETVAAELELLESASLSPLVDVDTTGFDSLLDFENFGFGNILDLLQAVSAFLSQFESFDFLDVNLPVIDKSFNDLLGLAEQYTQMIDDAIDNPATTLQLLETQLNTAIGISSSQFDAIVDVLNANDEADPGDTDPFSAPTDAVDIALVDGNLLQLSLNLGAVFTESLPVGFSDSDLNLPEVFGDTLNLAGFADLAAEGAVLMTLDFGIDTETGEFYILDGTQAVGGITVGGEHISFTAGLGPFMVAIGDKRLDNPAETDISQIHLQAAAGVKVDFAAGGMTTSEFDGGAIEGALLDVSGGVTLGGIGLGGAFEGTVGDGTEVISGSVDGRLPVFFPNEGNHIGDILIGETFGSGYGDLANIDSPFFKVDGTSPSAGDLVVDLSEPLGFFTDFSLDDLSLFSTLILAVDGVDYLLEFLHDTLSGEIGGFTFPILGDDFAKAADFFQTIRDELIGPLRDAIEAVEDAALDFADPDKNIISKMLFDLLGPDGLGILLPEGADPNSSSDQVWTDALSLASPGEAIGLMTNYDDYLFGTGFDGLNDYSESESDEIGETEILWNMTLGQVFSLVDAGFGFDIGIPGLGLETEGDFGLDVWWAMDLTFGLSFAEGFFIQVRNDEGVDPELEVHLEAEFSEGTEITGQLAFLQLVGTVTDLNIDNDLDITNGIDISTFSTGITAAFTIDLFNESLDEDAGDARIGFTQLGSLGFDFHVDAEATVALALELGLNDDLGLTGFPTVTSDFLLYWAINADLEDLSGDMISDGLKVVGFYDIQLDLGEYVSEVLGPIVDEVAKFTGPIQPIIDVFTTPLPPLAQLGLELTLLDLAATFGDFDPSLIETIAEVITLINEIAAISDDTSLLLPIADQFVVYNNGFDVLFSLTPLLTSAASKAEEVFEDAQDVAGAIGGLVGDVASAIGNLDGSGSADIGKTKKTMTKVTSHEKGAFGFPIFEDPMQILGLLMGNDAVLVTYDIGRFYAAFQWSQYFPVYGPLGIAIGLEISAEIDFAVGFDTAGIREFAETDFENPALILGGFYISDTENPDGSGLDVPELTFLGGITAAAELNLGIARAGVGGGLFIQIEFDLFDPNSDGKIRLPELAGNFLNEAKYGSPVLAPLAIFDVTGEIFAQLFAYLKIDFKLFSIDLEFDITPPITILTFEIDFARPPILATELDNGDLILNTGDYAEDRLLGITSDIGEVLTITKHNASGGKVQIDVTSPGAVLGEDSDLLLSYEMDEGSTLKINGGAGNDEFQLIGFDDDEIYLEVDLGEGDDILNVQGAPTSGVSGSRFNIIRGGAGNDIITATGGRDLIIGGSGVDIIDAGYGDDLVIGDEYEESGPTLTVKVKGTDSGDTLSGGAGNDILIGGGGVDDVSGNGGTDLVVGDGALLTFSSPSAIKVFSNLKALNQGGVRETEELATSFGDTLSGGANNDILFGGNGGDTIDGDGGADIIFGGFGPDSINGGSGADIIFGDTGFFAEADDKDNAVNGDGGEADEIYGGTGEDLIFGGGGGDLIYGDEGDPTSGAADTIYGNSGADVIHGDGGADWIYGNGEGDQIYGDDGDDNLDGGAGGDLIKGGDGDDVITATKGNDFLDGQEGSDNYLTKNQGGATGSLISVIDSGVNDDDNDVLLITGTPFDDTYLLRSNTDGSNAFVALLNDFNAVERINYSKSLERIKLDTSLGDDYVAADDTAAEFTIDGNLGDDRFQIGQMFRTQRTESDANVAIDDVFLTIETTRGWLSNGISQAMTIEGSAGNDEFTVFHNLAVLTLNGGDGDDIFTVRAFALAGSQEPQRERTDITGGAGADLVEYAVNAPVNIDGGDGFDTLVVIGTEFGDDFVVTEDGVYGAGLNVNFVNIESLRVDGAEGNDRFFVQSTSEKVMTELFGGLGEDTFFMSGDTPPVVSNDLLGHSGLVLHNIETTEDSDESFSTQSLFGISSNVADNEEPFAVIRQTDGSTIVTESSIFEGGGDSYEIVLTRKPDEDVVIKALAPLPSSQNRELGAFAFRVESPTGVESADGTSVSLTFTTDNWYLPQVVNVYADTKVLEDKTGKSPIGGVFVRPETDGFDPIADDNTNGIADDLEFSFDDNAYEGIHYGVINHIVVAGTDAIQGDLASDTVEDGLTVTLTDPLNGWAVEQVIGRSIQIIEGIGIGDSRYIVDAVDNAGTWTLTLDRAWSDTDLPDTDSTFEIRIDDALVGMVDSVNETPDALDIDGYPDDSTIFYAEADFPANYLPGGLGAEGLTGRILQVIGGAGAGQQRMILGHTGDNGLILNGDWSTDLDSTSVFRIEIYDGLILPSVQVQINDNDFNGIQVDETVGFDDDDDVLNASDVVDDYDTITAVIEGGDGDQIGEWDVLNIKLSKVPTGDVTVNFIFDEDQLEILDATAIGSGPITSMIFSNTDTASIVVRAVDDGLREGFHNELIQFEVSGGDSDATSEQTDNFFYTEDNATYFVGLNHRPDPAAIGTTDGIISVTVDGVDIYALESESESAGDIRYVISGNKIIFTDDDLENPGLVSVSGPIIVEYKTTNDGFASTFNPPILVRMSDNDAPTVLVRETNGSTDLIEVDVDGIEDIAAELRGDTYQLVLTASPEDGKTVTLTLTPEITKTTRTGGIRHDAIQVILSNPDLDARMVDNGDGTFTVTFDDSNWDIPLTVGIEAIDDEVVDGGDTKEFAPGPNTLSGILGPVFVDGAGGSGSMDINNPLMLPDETNVKPANGDLLDISEDGRFLTVNYDDLVGSLAENGLTEIGELIDNTIEVTAVQDLENLLHSTIGQFRQIIGLTGDLAGTGDKEVVIEINEAYGFDSEAGESWTDIKSYAITAQSLNFFVDETIQIDVMFVDDSDSPADSTGTLTTTRLYGLNMGPDITIGDQLRPGGISYNDLEVIDINLGVGNNTLNVLGTYKRDDGYQSWTIIRSGDETIPWDSDPNRDGDEMGDVVNLFVNEQDMLLFGLNDEASNPEDALEVTDYTGPEPNAYAEIYSEGADFGGDDSLAGMQLQIIEVDGDNVTVKQSLNIVGNSADTLELEGEFIPDEIAGDPADFPDGYQFRIINPADGNIAVDLGKGDDILNGAPNWGPGGSALESTLRIIAFGGEGDDQITGGSGNDILFGDKGRVDFFNEEGAIVTRLGYAVDPILGFVTSYVDDTNGDDPDTLTDSGAAFPTPDELQDGLGSDDIGLRGLYVDVNNGFGFLQTPKLILGNDATSLTTEPFDDSLDPPGPEAGDESEYRISTYPEDQTDGVVRDPSLILTVDNGVGGNDLINAGAGNDQVFGGAGNDTIDAGDGDNMVAGDGARIDLTLPTGDLAVFDSEDPTPVISLLTSFRSIGFAYGGNDTITSGNGRDRIIGGAGSDTVHSGDNEDIIFGDNGKISYDDGVITTIETLDYVGGPTDGAGVYNDTLNGEGGNDIIFGGLQGSPDIINGGAGDDILLGDNGKLTYDADAGGDLSTLDTIESYQDGMGGADTISGEAGSDTILGGTGGDTIYGDDVSASNGSDDGGDLIIGDNAVIDLILNSVSRITSSIDDGTTGGNDIVEANAGADIVMGGYGGDMLDAGDGDNIVIGDDATLIYMGLAYFPAMPTVRPGDDNDASDIDEIISTSTTSGGGVDTITTLGGNDIIIGGREGDTIDAGDGDNLVIGDSGRIRAAAADAPQISGQPMTLGTVETTQFDDGGADIINTGTGRDIVFGGAGGDNIDVDAGDNLVIGDDGKIVYTGTDFGGSGVGDDSNPADIDEIVSTSTTAGGGADSITSLGGDDIVIGGREGDTVDAGDGNNVVIGDSGQILAAADNAPQISGQPITFGVIETTETDDGGADSITTGSGEDWVLGGYGGDTLYLGAGADIALGDNGELIFDRDVTVSVDGESVSIIENGGDDASTLDRIRTTAPTLGGNDTINGEAGGDILIGGTGSDWVMGDDLTGSHGDTDGADLIVGDQVDIGLVGNVLKGVITTERDTSDAGDGDVLIGNHDEDILIGSHGDDMIDGDIVSGDADLSDDLIFGDQVSLYNRDSDTTSLRYRVLSGDHIYGRSDIDGTDIESGSVLVTGGAYDQRNAIDTQTDNGETLIPSGSTSGWASWQIVELDHNTTVAALESNRYGDDYIAGNAGHDMIFGQLGNDVIQGDGSIESAIASVDPDSVGAERVDDGLIEVTPGQSVAATSLDVTASFEAVTDGDDYIEGNGGDDVIFGGLGQDDIVGDNSSMFSLDSIDERTPSGSDLIFGGSGERIDRNDLVGDSEADIVFNERHARDADAIAGDNANIYRLVGINGAEGSDPFLSFNYDADSNYEDRGDRRIIARAVDLLDYTPGGEDYDANASADIGFADEIHGESGDDFIYGMVGGDILFGDSEDDDLIGGYGADWISGGTGGDGILGDDGRIFTSRNTTSGESLYGVAGFANNELDLTISTPGNMQQAVINVSGELKKTVDLTPFKLTDSDYDADDPADADDILYGGWGDDFMHGGAGDDAMSGAEALEMFFDSPIPMDDVLRFGELRAGEFYDYDEYNALARIGGFLLNFNEAEGEAVDDDVSSDGNDRLFGDLGNDWIVGGTGQDRMYGGFGNDLLNADDDLSTNGGHNDVPDTDPSYEDIAYGGAGRDVLIGNTGGDRLIDWVGEFNSYLVPFAPFGAATVSRTLQPQLMDYLYDLSEGDGADPTRAADTGSDPDRNGEPYGELGVVVQKDFYWQDQTGAPADPQAGNIPGGARDVLRSADFNDGQNLTMFADSGEWTVDGSVLQVTATDIGGDAVAVLDLDDQLPSYFEIVATITMEKPKGGWKANSYVIFDYQSETDFKFAGIDASRDKMQLGHRTAEGWIIDAETSAKIRPGEFYNVLVAVNGTNVTVAVNGQDYFAHTYDPRVDADGWVYGLNDGMVGFGAENSKGTLDNIAVQVLPPEYTLNLTEDFEDADVQFLAVPVSGEWTLAGGEYQGVAQSGSRAISLLDVGMGHDGGLQENSVLDISATLNTEATSGIVFDYYSSDDFKYAGFSAEGDEIVIGHYKGGQWYVDSRSDYVVSAGVDYDLGLSIKGTTVDLSLRESSAENWQAKLGHVFNAVAVDGGFGLLVIEGSASFDSVSVATNDAFFSEHSDALMAKTLGAETEATPVSAEALNLLLVESKQRLARLMKLGDAEMALLDSVQIDFADLEGRVLAETSGLTITLDHNGAGHGWFVDATASMDEEFRSFTPQSGNRVATPSSEAAGQSDLLSVLVHELGHVLSLEHGTGFMDANLAAGERFLMPSEALATPQQGASLATKEAAQVQIFDEVLDRLYNPAEARLISMFNIQPAELENTEENTEFLIKIDDEGNSFTAENNKKPANPGVIASDVGSAGKIKAGVVNWSDKSNIVSLIKSKI